MKGKAGGEVEGEEGEGRGKGGFHFVLTPSDNPSSQVISGGVVIRDGEVSGVGVGGWFTGLVGVLEDVRGEVGRGGRGGEDELFGLLGGFKREGVVSMGYGEVVGYEQAIITYLSGLEDDQSFVTKTGFFLHVCLFVCFTFFLILFSSFFFLDNTGKTLLHLAVLCSLKNLVEHLTTLSSHPSLLLSQDMYGATPLHYAAWVGDLSLVESLLSPSVGEEVDKGGLLPKDYALRGGWKGGELLRLLGMSEKEIQEEEQKSEEKGEEEGREREEEVAVDDSAEMMELTQAIIKGESGKISQLLDSGSVSVKGYAFYSLNYFGSYEEFSWAKNSFSSSF